jgi:hypothetical protein
VIAGLGESTSLILSDWLKDTQKNVRCEARINEREFDESTHQQSRPAMAG